MNTHTYQNIENLVNLEKFLMTLTSQSLHLYQETTVLIYVTED